MNHETHRELGLGSLNRSLLQILIQRNGRAGAALCDVTRLGHHIADHRRSGRSAASATTIEHQIVGGFGLHKHRVKGTMHGSQRMLVGNQRRIHAGRHTGLAILHHGQQLDDLVFGGCGSNIVGGDLGDALNRHIVDGHVGVETERGHDGRLVGRIVAFDVSGRIRFGVSLGLSVLQHVVEIKTFGGHFVENVVRGAVDDAKHARHLVSDEGFTQWLEERNRTAHGSLEVDIDALGFGGSIDFWTILGQQRLVGGNHGSAGFDGRKHELAGHAGSANQFDHNVGIGGHAHGVGGHHGLVDPRERVGFRRIKAGDAGQFDRSSDACGKLILLLHQQACGLRADRARAQQSNANRRNIFLCQGILP